MILPEKIKQLRKQKQLTQAELADLLFVSRSSIAKYETGRVIPDNEVIEKMAKIFEVDKNDLILEEDNREIALQTSKRIKTLWTSLHIFVIVLCAFLIVFLLLPIFEYGHYVYPIPDGQVQPDYIYGEISLITSCLRLSNYVGIFAIISLTINVALSFALLFIDKQKVANVLKIINFALLAISLFLVILTTGFGISYMSNIDFSMNRK